MKRITKLLAFLLLSLMLVGNVVPGYAKDTVQVEAAAKKAGTPVPSLESGTYYVNGYKYVTLSCATPGADIYYSIDGGYEYELYTGKFKITESCYLVAYALVNDDISTLSDLAVYSYDLKVKLSGISPSDTKKKYTKPFYFKVSTDAKKVKIYYTLDGTKPTAKSKQYTDAGIYIKDTTTVRLLIKKSGFTNRYITKKYVFDKTDSKPETPASNEDKTTVTATPVYGSKYGYIDLSDYKDRFYYNNLNDSEKKLYDQMYKGVAEHKSYVSLTNIPVSTDIGKVYELMMSESPELFYAYDSYIQYYYDSKNITRADFSYTDDEKSAADIKVKLEKKADEIIAAAEKNSSDLFEFVLYLHDWIVNNAEYELGNSATRELAGPNDIIVDGHGLCAAYARAFMYLLHRSGINCVSVAGKADNGDHVEPHAWSKVLLDGNWYSYDVTWDDPTDYDGPTVYSYFGLTDSELGENHYASDYYKFSAFKGTATDYNYYKYYGITVYDNAKTAANALVNKVKQAPGKSGSQVEIVCKNQEIAENTYYLAYDILNESIVDWSTISYYGNTVSVIF